jgi:hypothetical protein
MRNRRKRWLKCTDSALTVGLGSELRLTSILIDWVGKRFTLRSHYHYCYNWLVAFATIILNFLATSNT